MVMDVAVSLVLLFVGIGFLVLVHVCIVGRAFRRGFRNYNETIGESGRFGSTTTSMSQDDLEKLPCFDFEKGSSPVDCVFCLENFKVGEKCRLLPLCKHSFHAECVDLWLLKTPICPICRTSTESWKKGGGGGGGSVSGEESGHFSGSGIELRESQTTESGRSSEVAGESREGQTTESDHFCAIEIESGVEEETREPQAVGSTHLSEGGVGIENQTSLVGSQV